MNIGCTLLKSDGSFKNALIPEEIAMDLMKKLREDGKQYVRFSDEEILCEGLFIPAKDTDKTLMALPAVE